MFYPVKVTKEDGYYLAEFSIGNNFQGVADGDTKEEALDALQAVLEYAIAKRIRNKELFPLTRLTKKDKDFIAINPNLAGKAYIHLEMLKKNLKKADMARAMNVDQKQIDRLLNPKHSTSLKDFARAAKVFGKSFTLEANHF